MGQISGGEACWFQSACFIGEFSLEGEALNAATYNQTIPVLSALYATLSTTYCTLPTVGCVVFLEQNKIRLHHSTHCGLGRHNIFKFKDQWWHSLMGEFTRMLNTCFPLKSEDKSPNAYYVAHELKLLCTDTIKYFVYFSEMKNISISPKL